MPFFVFNLARNPCRRFCTRREGLYVSRLTPSEAVLENVRDECAGDTARADVAFWREERIELGWDAMLDDVYEGVRRRAEGWSAEEIVRDLENSTVRDYPCDGHEWAQAYLDVVVDRVVLIGVQAALMHRRPSMLFSFAVLTRGVNSSGIQATMIKRQYLPLSLHRNLRCSCKVDDN